MRRTTRDDDGGGAARDGDDDGDGAARDADDDGAGPARDADDDTFAIPITDELDLHTIPARDVPGVVAEYLHEAQRAGLIEVRIVHGKGIGVQREAVARVLSDHPAVASFGAAPAHRGHWGATIVRLRRV